MIRSSFRRLSLQHSGIPKLLIRTFPCQASTRSIMAGSRLPSTNTTLIVPHTRIDPRVVFPVVTQRKLSSRAEDRKSMPAKVFTKRFKYMSGIVADPSRYDAQSLQGALYFWMGTNARQNAAQKGLHYTEPLLKAKSILDYAMAHENPKLLLDVLSNNQNQWSPNAGFLKLARHFLQPLDGRRASLERTRGRAKQGRWTVESDVVNALKLASSIIDSMNQCQESDKYPTLKADTFSCRATLNLWYRRARFLAERNDTHSLATYQEALGGARAPRDCIRAMEQLIAQMEDPTNDELPEPDTACYSYLFSVRSAWKVTGAADECVQLLDRIRARDPARLDTADEGAIAIYNSVLLAFANDVTVLSVAGNKRAAAAKLQEAWALWESLRGTELNRHPISFSIIMKACGRAGDVRKCTDLLAEMIAREIPTSKIHFNIVMNAFAESNSQPLDKIESILQQMITMAQSGHDTQPDCFTYSSYIKACLQKTTADGTDKADALLDSLEMQSPQTFRILDRGVYRAFMRGLCGQLYRIYDAQAREAIAIKIESLLDRLERRSKIDKNVQGPDVTDLNECMNAWAKANSRKAPERQMHLFQTWRRSSRSKFDGNTYRFLLKGLGRLLDSGGALDTAAEILQCMKEDNIPWHMGTMNQYVFLLARFGENDEAEAFIQFMEDAFAKGEVRVRPQENTYRYVLNEYWKRGMVEKAQTLFEKLQEMSKDRPDLAPSEKSYTAMIHAWSSSRDSDYLNQVERLFSEIKRISKPSTYTYAAYQKAWRRSARSDAPVKLEAILYEMQTEYDSGLNPNCKPVAPNFFVVIDGWSAVGDDASSERAEAILKLMEQAYDGAMGIGVEHLRPTVACYISVLKAWSGSKKHGRTKVIELLDHMEARYSANKTSPRPTESCYHHAMNGVVSDGDEQSLLELERLFERMKSDYASGSRFARPTVATYLLLLSKCADIAHTSNMEPTRTAVRVTRLAFWDFLEREDLRDNVEVHLQFLLCCSRLLLAGSERDDLVEQGLAQCPPAVLQNTDLVAKVNQIVPQKVSERILSQTHQHQ